MKSIIYSTGLIIFFAGIGYNIQAQPRGNHQNNNHYRGQQSQHNGNNSQHNNNSHQHSNNGHQHSNNSYQHNYNQHYAHADFRNHPGNGVHYVDRRVNYGYARPHYYGVMPVYRSTVAYAPSSAIIISNRGINFRYYNGIYYQPVVGGYSVAAAPWGVRVRTLPAGCQQIWVSNVPYYYYYGSFYTQTVQSNEYEAIQPPIGAKVDFLPEGASKVFIEGNTYYEVNGTYYKAYTDESGAVWYEVVGQK